MGYLRKPAPESPESPAVGVPLLFSRRAESGRRMPEMTEWQSRCCDSINASPTTKKQPRLQIRIGKIESQSAAKSVDGLEVSASDCKTPPGREDLRWQSAEQFRIEMPLPSPLDAGDDRSCVFKQRSQLRNPSTDRDHVIVEKDQDLAMSPRSSGVPGGCDSVMRLANA